MKRFIPVILVGACMLMSCAGRLQALEGEPGGGGDTGTGTGSGAGGAPFFNECGFAILTQECSAGDTFARCKSCSGFPTCHGKDTPSNAGLDLTASGIGNGTKYVNHPADDSIAGSCGAGAMPTTIMGQVYIDPVNPENSLIYRKVTTAPGCGSRMPFASTVFLSDADQLCILNWIKSVPGVRQGGAGGAGGFQ